MKKGQAARPSQELRHFTNREKEEAVLRRHLDAAEGSALPVVMFYGVGGVGKTWLTKRLRGLLSEAPLGSLGAPLPSARLDLDEKVGSRFHKDPAAAYLQIRLDLGVECPAFDLAYAMLRHKQNGGAEPELRHGGKLNTAWELVSEIGSMATQSVPGGNLIVWAGKKITARIGQEFKQTALGERLLASTGNAEFFALRRLDVDDLYRLLPERLVADLEANLPERPGKACRAVIFIDTFEHLRRGLGSEVQHSQREAWIRDLYERVKSVLVIIAGRDRLTWGCLDPDWNDSQHLEQHLLGGLSQTDAESFLGKVGVPPGQLRRAVLRACIDVAASISSADAGSAYHPLSLGLCADAIVSERNRGIETDPESFDIHPDDSAALAERFLASLGTDALVGWIKRLALVPRFDETAARLAYSPMPGANQDAAWEDLKGYSFVNETDQHGWWTLHPRMKAALHELMTDEVRHRVHHEWRAHWLSRARNEVDEFAALAWRHWWVLEPVQALGEWNSLAQRARDCRQPDMALHHHLLHWWKFTDLETTTEESSHSLIALNILAEELMEASVGSLDNYALRAIACCEAAVSRRIFERPFVSAQIADLWADFQNLLGRAYSRLSEKRKEHMQEAVVRFEAALNIHTEEDYPEDWAHSQFWLGNVYLQLPIESQTLERARERFEASSRVLSAHNHPNTWYALQNSLGIVYLNLPTGDRQQNIRRAISHLEASGANEHLSAPDRAGLQCNLGQAFLNLAHATGDNETNIQHAIVCFEKALNAVHEEAYPHQWAHAHALLGRAYSQISPLTDWGQHIDRIIGHYQTALQTFLKHEALIDSARTQLGLADIYLRSNRRDQFDNLSQAMRCSLEALKIFEEHDCQLDSAKALMSLGRTWVAFARCEEALECFEHALEIYSKYQYPRECAEIWQNIEVVKRALAEPKLGSIDPP
jgi:tetratricopeptide (TPR) repeat protein